MKIFNSLGRKMVKFEPENPPKVTIYVCGITPYDTTHLGHAYTYVFFDVLQRYLKFKGYQVNYVQNVTDIDDDILRKAKEVKKDWQELGQFWTERFLEDMKALNVKPPTHLVKATQSIPKMIQIIKVLIKKGVGYETNGNVYFEVKKFPHYGRLSKSFKHQMMLLLKERGGDPNDPNKKYPLDFLLWQKSKGDEPFWDSPWGKGRPGWHIECSAMIYEFLGEQIDIHGGGRDLIYPHHESEIAQSESFTGKKFVKYWVHVCMVLYQGEKMAKSLGNLVMVKDLLKKYSANTIRFLLLSHHYRSPWEFTQDNLKKIDSKVKLIETIIGGAKNISYPSNLSNQNNLWLKKFTYLMDQDLNTPEVLKYLITLAKTNQPDQLKKIFQILGFKLT